VAATKTKDSEAAAQPAAAAEDHDPRAHGAPMDALLTDSGPVGLGRFVPGKPILKAAGRLTIRPDRVAKRLGATALESAKVWAGRSDIEPPKGDRRFKDQAWEGNPAFRRLKQLYLLWCREVDGLIDDADLDWQDERRLRFAADNVVDALAPTNFPAANPAVLKATLDNGGSNLTSGAKKFVQDMARSPRIPNMVDTSEFEIGENIAVTPGAVVLRTDVFELIQYEPRTSQVREVPLVVVPPMINKFYVTDLAENRSMIQHQLEAGQQVFCMSWRNPGEEQADWGLDTYAAAVVEALDAAQAITASETVHMLGLCAGGILTSAVAAHLYAKGEGDRLAGITLGVCVLDNERAGTMGAMVDREVATLAMADSARRGYLKGQSLAGVFAWLRPNDLVWNYWVNNYLLGKDPPAFDILFWNADSTNLPAALHRDFLEMSIENSIVHPGELTVLGTPVDLSKIKAPTYLVAGIADHIIPWENAYKTVHLYGSKPKFVLSTSGHIAALVNPPGNEKASFQTNPANPKTPEQWLEGASKRRGTWWDDWSEWLGDHSGDMKRKPAKLGQRGFTPLADAPGDYVHG
jgi:class II poly(R)-hydroxyalkanoic acid synthase